MRNHDFSDLWASATVDALSRDRPWVMTQTWHDLLFAHWPLTPSQIRPLVPAPFELDLFDHQAWIGIVPFRMSNVSPRGVPSLPWVSRFAELNVRTYVRVGDRAGVFFLSLDAASALAVAAARGLLNLPYYRASMQVASAGGRVAYRSGRHSVTNARFEATYGPIGPVFRAHPDSLEYFLTERYCLYHLTARGAPYRLDIHHLPWPLQPASATIDHNTMAAAHGIRLPEPVPLLHFAERLDVVAWAATSL